MQQRTTATVKRANQVLESVLNKPTPVSFISAKKLDDTSQETTRHQERIATLWLQLTDIYGTRFVNVYGEIDSGVWYQALSDLTEEDWSFGLKAMLRDPRFETWPPNCTQFRHLCLNKISGSEIPSVHKAFAEARLKATRSSPQQWSHPAVKYTVKHLGLTKMNDGDTYKVFNEFNEFYHRVCERVSKGFSIPFVANEELIDTSVRKNPIPRLAHQIRP